jgi:hypothetical protein
MTRKAAPASWCAFRRTITKWHGARCCAAIQDARQPTHATERARLRDKEMRSRQTKETGFAFRSSRPCVTRHKRETKPQDGKLESVQGSPRQSGQMRSEPSRLSRAKVGYCRPQTRLAGMAAKWRQCEPRRHDDTKQVDKDSGLRGEQRRA